MMFFTEGILSWGSFVMGAFVSNSSGSSMHIICTTKWFNVNNCHGMTSKILSPVWATLTSRHSQGCFHYQWFTLGLGWVRLV